MQIDCRLSAHDGIFGDVHTLDIGARNFKHWIKKKRFLKRVFESFIIVVLHAVKRVNARVRQRKMKSQDKPSDLGTFNFFFSLSLYF